MTVEINLPVTAQDVRSFSERKWRTNLVYSTS